MAHAHDIRRIIDGTDHRMVGSFIDRQGSGVVCVVVYATRGGYGHLISRLDPARDAAAIAEGNAKAWPGISPAAIDAQLTAEAKRIAREWASAAPASPSIAEDVAKRPQRTKRTAGAPQSGFRF